MSCRCNEVTELYGNEAEEYASEHLLAGRSNAVTLQQEFSCPDTGRDWLLDFPDKTEREPGAARLAQVPG